jgi:hypothetical protein
MKRNASIKILEDNGVVFFRHGSEHDIYIKNRTGESFGSKTRRNKK